MQIRQGDVLLKEVDAFPEGVTEKDKVIAYGEVTGHKHQFVSEQVLVFKDDKGKQFVDVQQESELVHEEHQNKLVPQGKYEVVIQREFDIVEGVKRVMD